MTTKQCDVCVHHPCVSSSSFPFPSFHSNFSSSSLLVLLLILLLPCDLYFISPSLTPSPSFALSRVASLGSHNTTKHTTPHHTTPHHTHLPGSNRWLLSFVVTLFGRVHAVDSLADGAARRASEVTASTSACPHAWPLLRPCTTAVANASWPLLKSVQTEHAPVTEHVAPAPDVMMSPPSSTIEYVVENVAPEQTVTCAVTCPVSGCVYPAPDHSYAAPAPVVGYVDPAPADTYTAPADTYTAPAPAITLVDQHLPSPARHQLL